MTTNDALTAALEISDLILEDLEEDETDIARDQYISLRDLIIPRLNEIGTDTREGKLISNMIDIADDHFDL